MNIKYLTAYIKECNELGLTPTWTGLKEYYQEQQE